MISFDRIPVDLRTPGQFIEFDSSKALGGLAVAQHKILVIGQRLDTGTVAELVPTLVTSAEAAETAFGRGSMLSLMVRALRQVNPWTETWAIALDDADAAQAAAGSIAFGGTGIQAGTVNLYIAGERVRVGVTAAQTPAQVATATATAINALTDLPVTAEVNGDTDTQVDITARNAGLAGNAIDVRFNYYQGEALPGGLTATVTGMSGGTANPDLADAIDVVADTGYHSWIVPYADQSNLDALAEDLDRRWGPTVQLDAHAYVAASDSLANLSTLGAAQNSEHVSLIGASKSPTSPWAWAAAFGGVCAYYGSIDPARPMQTLPLAGVLAPAQADRFDRAEREVLLHDGIATWVVGDDGTVRIERAITTYQTNAGGAPDTAYLDLNTKLTLAALRYSLRQRIATRYPRHKLASDGAAIAPGQAIVTPKILRAELIALAREWEAAGLAENIDAFKEALIVERSSTDPNRVDALVPPDVINQFRVFAASIQFRL